MPIIKINVPENSISQDKKNKIIKYLSQAILKIEGLPNTKEARSLVWCFFNELKKDTWAVGGELCNELKFYIQILLFKEIINEKKKKEIAVVVNKTLKEVCNRDFKSNKAWILINEIPDYNFCIEGINFGVNELVKLLNLKSESLKS